MNFALPAKEAAAPARAEPAALGKLKIGAPDDTFEHEADRMAGEAMAADPSRPRWSFAKLSVSPRVQRECACDGECEDCKEKKLQRKAAGEAVSGRDGPSQRPHRFVGPGTPARRGPAARNGSPFRLRFFEGARALRPRRRTIGTRRRGPCVHRRK